jgi:sulfur-oxidizing protein SoxA
MTNSKPHWNKRVKKSSTVRLTGILASIIPALLIQQNAMAGPEEDRLAFVAFFQARFPEIPIAEFANGIYAIDSDARDQWIDIEDFPPYEFTIDAGEMLWQDTFANGKTYSDCFAEQIENIRPRYPLFDGVSGEVVTLELAINNCRSTNDEPAFAYDGKEVTAITAFLAYESRGQQLDIRVPEDDSRALDAYESGKQFYYTKRGQLNFACSDCHGISSGQYVRADRLSTGLGHPTHFPVYRSKTGGMVSLHQRFSGCVRDVRAVPFEQQSIEFRNLEYFLTYMSNGFEVNGPASRK